MKFGYTIIYVADAAASLEFFGKAFGLSTRFIHESGYGELETGETTLAFAAHELGRSNLPAGYVAADVSHKPLGIEIALVTNSVAEAHSRAISAGAISPKNQCKNHGGRLSYVQCPDGTLVELCSPINP